MSEGREISIQVPVLARVEGEGALTLRVSQGRIEELALRIFEPPRLFEKFLEGRDYTEVPDMVARICGICPVAYQMSAVHALESLFQVDPGPWVRAMRRVLYCGEWLQSHSLHIHLLAAPDFLGYPDVTALARDFPDIVRRGLMLQALGNDLMRLFGGRSVHPVGVRVGGFHHAPAPRDVAALRDKLCAALSQAEALVRWTASLPLPEQTQAFTCVALRHGDEYPLNTGRIVSESGLDIAPSEYHNHFCEFQVPHSTAFHALLHDQPYLVGPLARLNLNLDRLPGAVRAVLDETGIAFPSHNMFHSVVARAVEILYALHEAVRLLDDYRVPDRPYADIVPRAGIGHGCTEAPRGLLWHAYEVDAAGRVVRATIIPPTSQNQARIEQDLRMDLEHFGLDRTDQELRQRAEMIIRNYDPCISCATHFLTLEVQRA